MKKRIKQVRKDSGLTQEEFAKRLKLSRNFIWMAENGRCELSDRTITDIAREFGVNEEWLRTGEGEPYVQRSREDQLTEAVNRLLSGENPEFKRRLVVVLSTLDDSQWSFLEEKLLEIVGDRKAPVSVPPSAPEPTDPKPWDEMTKEEKIAEFARQLDEEEESGGEEPQSGGGATA